MALQDDRFIRYPAGYLFGVVDDRAQAEALLGELHEAGFEEAELLHFTGERGAERIDGSGEQHGLFARLVRLLEYADDSRLHAEQYEREARAGHCVIGVHAPEKNEKARSRELLKARGAHFINYYSRHNTTESLDP
jgi:hypothetical protein